MGSGTLTTKYMQVNLRHNFVFYNIPYCLDIKMVCTMALSIYVNCEIHINLAEGEIYTKYITHKVLLIIRDRDRMVV